MAVVSLCLVQFMDVLGVTVVVTSLPAMLASLAVFAVGALVAAAAPSVLALAAGRCLQGAAAATSGTPALGTPPPRAAWAVAALVAAAGAAWFAVARPGRDGAGEAEAPAVGDAATGEMAQGAPDRLSGRGRPG